MSSFVKNPREQWESFVAATDHGECQNSRLTMTIRNQEIIVEPRTGSALRDLVDEIRGLPGMRIGKHFEEVLAMEYWKELWDSRVEQWCGQSLALAEFNINAGHGNRVHEVQRRGYSLPFISDVLVVAASPVANTIDAAIAFPHNSRVFFTIGGITPKPRYFHLWPTENGYELELSYIDDCWNTGKRTCAVPKETLYVVRKPS